MKYAKVLFKAAELIEERGFAQGMYQGLSGELCLVAAVRVASGLPPAPRPYEARPDAVEYLEEVSGEDCDCLETFNNNGLTSKQEAIDFLIGAAYFK